MNSFPERKLEIEGTPSATLWLMFVVPNVVYFYDHQMSIVKHFSVDSSNLNLETKRRLNLNDSL